MQLLKFLPIELVDHILEFTFYCKKEKNIYLNKEIFEKFKKKQIKCSNKNLWGHSFCRVCDKKELDYIKYLRLRYLFGPLHKDK